jgi:MoaA/NifB/PqqE/SkfB family radical SAM enzyme
MKYKNLSIAVKRIRALAKLKDAYRGENKLLKYSIAGRRFFFSYNAPGWPSKSFNRYISYQLSQFDADAKTALHTLIFGITKKCGFKCEHCFEWENLNKAESLAKQDITRVIKGFRDLGVSMVQLSGGEPLNRLSDITEIIPLFRDIDFWLYTSGYHLTVEKAHQLKKAGLTGITISLDDWRPSVHDSFRGKPGSFDWVEKAAKNTVENNLALCLSLCATNDFISTENLYHYIELAKNLNASFVQILEPKPVGHYAGKKVTLTDEKIDLLEGFYKDINFNTAFKAYPTVIYHGFYSRRLGCSGGGKDYLYVDMDGYAHDCPFCQKKLFNVLEGDLEKQVERMKTFGCNVFKSTT